MILALILSVTFFVLALIHFNWIIGGSFGFTAALPTKETGQRVLNPKKIDSAIVGLGLTAFGLFYLTLTNLISLALPLWVLTYLVWIIPAIFLLRAIGDFKYVGFFKRITTTEFAKFDNKLFSPLCLLTAVLGVLIAIFN